MRYGLTIALMLAWVEMVAAGFEWDIKSLSGVGQIGVVIGDLTPEVERDGLSEHLLRTDVELRLRKAGINVLSEEKYMGTVGPVCLHWMRQFAWLN